MFVLKYLAGEKRMTTSLNIREWTETRSGNEYRTLFCIHMFWPANRPWVLCRSRTRGSSTNKPSCPNRKSAMRIETGFWKRPLQQSNGGKDIRNNQLASSDYGTGNREKRERLFCCTLYFRYVVFADTTEAISYKWGSSSFPLRSVFRFGLWPKEHTKSVTISKSWKHWEIRTDVMGPQEIDATGVDGSCWGFIVYTGFSNRVSRIISWPFKEQNLYFPGHVHRTVSRENVITSI